MKKCPICGCFNEESALRCSICGVNFPKNDLGKPLASPAHAQSEAQACRLAPPMKSQDETQACRPSPADGSREESNKSDRMAIAGFVLSLIGLVTVVSSPLQLTALLLSLAADGTKRFCKLRTLGVVFSAVCLGFSLLFWLLFSLFGGSIVSIITDALNNYH